MHQAVHLIKNPLVFLSDKWHTRGNDSTTKSHEAHDLDKHTKPIESISKADEQRISTVSTIINVSIKFPNKTTAFSQSCADATYNKYKSQIIISLAERPNQYNENEWRNESTGLHYLPESDKFEKVWSERFEQ
jgi:hypothetical protein